jgi:hypothetical protein
MSAKYTKAAIRAAERADWQQVVLNGGPPCFALPPLDNGTFCLRAERWSGHDGSAHAFVPLAAMLRRLVVR